MAGDTAFGPRFRDLLHLCALAEVSVNAAGIAAELRKREANVNLWEVVTRLLNDYWPFPKWRHWVDVGWNYEARWKMGLVLFA